MDHRTYFLNQLKKDAKLRKAHYEAQFDINFQASLAVEGLRLELGLTREQLAKKSGVPVGIIRKAESGAGVSLMVLGKLARSCGRKVEFNIEPATPLKDIVKEYAHLTGQKV